MIQAKPEQPNMPAARESSSGSRKRVTFTMPPPLPFSAYDRFTDEARCSMQLANQVATRCEHEYISPEHILLGVLAQQGSVPAICQALGISVTEMQGAIEDSLAVSAPQSQTPRAKKVIEQAIALSRALGHGVIDTHHVFLGALCVPDSPLVQWLEKRGVTLDQVRAEVLRRFPAELDPSAPWSYDDLVKGFKTHSEFFSARERMYQVQRQLEEALANQDFEGAVALRDQRRKLEDELRTILDRLQNEANEEGSS